MLHYRLWINFLEKISLIFFSSTSSDQNPKRKLEDVNDLFPSMIYGDEIEGYVDAVHANYFTTRR